MEQNGVCPEAQAVQTEYVGKQEVPNEGENSALAYQEEEEEEEMEEEALASIKEDVTEDAITPKGKKGQSASEFDSEGVFNDVFGTRREFDSWDEFTDYLEEFQTKSGTRFKPRSACRVDHVNERRIGSPIPERFVYAAIKMICVHYGEGGSGKRKNYVGKGCEAFMRVSYSKGAMRVTQTHLLHTNHGPIFETNHPHTRNFRVFNFTEELDYIIVQEVLKANPFEFKNGEKEWSQAVDCLKSIDERFSSITPRLIKKRIRLLLDNFTAISQGKKPSADDEMGTILFKLDQTKKNASDVTTPAVKTRKRRGRGRPRKVSESEEENDFFENEDDMVAYTPAPSSKRAKTKPQATPSPAPAKVVSSGEMSLLLSYLQKKDEDERKLQRKELEEDRRLRQREVEEDRKLRQNEMEEDRKLRQRELDLRREELAFQKERFELEKTERKVHMDLLKSQLQVFEQSMLAKQQPQPPTQTQTLMPMTITQPLPPQPQPPQQQQPPAQQQPRDIRPQAGEYQFHYR